MLLKYFGFAGEGDIIMMTTPGDTGITMQLSFALEVSQRKRIESLLCLDLPLNLSFSSIVVKRLRESFLKVISRISDYNRHNTRKLCVIWDNIEHVPFVGMNSDITDVQKQVLLLRQKVCQELEARVKSFFWQDGYIKHLH